jgi:hypothetical protein
VQGKEEITKLSLLRKSKSISWHLTGKNFVLERLVVRPLASANNFRIELVTSQSC